MKAITLATLQAMKANREKFAVLTAYDASFAQQAEKAGIDFDWEILSLQIPVDQPPKQWMYLPALMLLGMVVFMQRRRRAFSS